MPSSPAGWFPDPSRRHEYRYFDGSQWTVHVSDQGVQSQDSPDWWQQATMAAGTTAQPSQARWLTEKERARVVPGTPEYMEVQRFELSQRTGELERLQKRLHRQGRAAGSVRYGKVGREIAGKKVDALNGKIAAESAKIQAQQNQLMLAMLQQQQRGDD